MWIRAWDIPMVPQRSSLTAIERRWWNMQLHKCKWIDKTLFFQTSLWYMYRSNNKRREKRKWYLIRCCLFWWRSYDKGIIILGNTGDYPLLCWTILRSRAYNFLGMVLCSQTMGRILVEGSHLVASLCPLFAYSSSSATFTAIVVMVNGLLLFVIIFFKHILFIASCW